MRLVLECDDLYTVEYGTQWRGAGQWFMHELKYFVARSREGQLSARRCSKIDTQTRREMSRWTHQTVTEPVSHLIDSCSCCLTEAQIHESVVHFSNVPK